MLKKTILGWLVGAIGPWYLESLGSSLRWEVRGAEHFEALRGRAHVLAFWHARMLIMGYFFRHRGYHVLVSENTDGEIGARVLAHEGVEAGERVLEEHRGLGHSRSPLIT